MKREYQATQDSIFKELQEIEMRKNELLRQLESERDEALKQVKMLIAVYGFKATELGLRKPRTRTTPLFTDEKELRQ